MQIPASSTCSYRWASLFLLSFLSMTSTASIRSNKFRFCQQPTNVKRKSFSVSHSCNYFSSPPLQRQLVIWLDSLYLSIRNCFLSSFQIVLSVKYKLKGLLFRVLIYGALREFIWHDSLSSPCPFTGFNDKKKSTNRCTCLRHSQTRSPLVFVFLSLPTCK